MRKIEKRTVICMALAILMAAGMLVCFTLLGDILDLRTWSGEVRLVMGTLLLMTPTVFFTIQRLFDTVYDARLRLAAWAKETWHKMFKKA